MNQCETSKNCTLFLGIQPPWHSQCSSTSPRSNWTLLVFHHSGVLHNHRMCCSGCTIDYLFEVMLAFWHQVIPYKVSKSASKKQPQHPRVDEDRLKSIHKIFRVTTQQKHFGKEATQSRPPKVLSSKTKHHQLATTWGKQHHQRGSSSPARAPGRHFLSFQFDTSKPKTKHLTIKVLPIWLAWDPILYSKRLVTGDKQHRLLFDVCFSLVSSFSPLLSQTPKPWDSATDDRRCRRRDSAPCDGGCTWRPRSRWSIRSTRVAQNTGGQIERKRGLVSGDALFQFGVFSLKDI